MNKKMKLRYRYNGKTEEWEIVFTLYDYYTLRQEIEMLRQQASRQLQQPPLIQPIAPPQPNIYPYPDPYKSPIWYGGLAPRSWLIWFR